MAGLGSVSGVFLAVDKVGAMLEAVNALTTADVLVGVPSAKTSRKAEPNKGPITNATLAYIHEFGSPARRIPPRPFLFPGVRNAREAIAARMRLGAQQALKGDMKVVSRTLNAVGMIGRNSVVQAITSPSPPFTPLRPATIRARLMKTGAGRRRLKEVVEGGRQLGMSSSQSLSVYAQARWATGGAGLNVQPLIDTGQLRASVTYVVRMGAIASQYATTFWGYQRDYGKMHLQFTRNP